MIGLGVPGSLRTQFPWGLGRTTWKRVSLGLTCGGGQEGSWHLPWAWAAKEVGWERPRGLLWWAGPCAAVLCTGTPQRPQCWALETAGLRFQNPERQDDCRRSIITLCSGDTHSAPQLETKGKAGGKLPSPPKPGNFRQLFCLPRGWRRGRRGVTLGWMDSTSA